MDRFVVDPERSTIVVQARSTAGPIEFEAVGPIGEFTARIEGGSVVVDGDTAGRLEVELERLTSGNSLYDTELLRRIDARRHPLAVAELLGHRRLEEEAFQLEGRLTLHGRSQVLEGTVTVSAPSPDEILVIGEHQLDLRDFAIPQPGILMLRIFPEVDVRLFVAAVREPS